MARPKGQELIIGDPCRVCCSFLCAVVSEVHGDTVHKQFSTLETTVRPFYTGKISVETDLVKRKLMTETLLSDRFGRLH